MPKLAKADHRRRNAIIAAALLLTLERRARAALHAALVLTVRHFAAIDASPAVAELAIARTQAVAIRRLRSTARDSARTTWQRQTGLDAEVEAVSDAKASASAARKIAARWRQIQNELEADGEASRATTYTAAAAATEARANVVAATENAKAWNEEHERLARDLEARGYAATFTWEAEGDSHTCADCSSLDGMTVTSVDDFPEGLPPIHASCRCQFTTSIEQQEAA